MAPDTACADTQYQQIRTSQGKVILGLTGTQALERFGLPSMSGDELWYYAAQPEAFFVDFSQTPLLSINLYPQSIEAPEGATLELKAIGNFADFTTRDITSQVNFLTEQAGDLIIKDSGIIIPQKAGTYQIIAAFKDVFSSPSSIVIKDSPQKEEESEKLLNIDVLPYTQMVPVGCTIRFFALGTFLNYSKDEYAVRDISKDVNWYLKKDGQVSPLQDFWVEFASPGKFAVYCKYKNFESYHQEIKVLNEALSFQEILKHITVLPEFVSIPYAKTVDLKAYGTYLNYKVEDITDKVKWNIENRNVITEQENGRFLATSTGIADITAQANNLQSSPAKIIVLDKKDFPSNTVVYKEPQEREIHLEGLSEDIKNDIGNLRKNLLKETHKLTQIKIFPENVFVPLGEKRQLIAFGTYSDGYQKDLTFIGSWSSSIDRIATVQKGKVDTHSVGEAGVQVRIQDITSLPASVIVGAPRLVSIIIFPQEAKISMKDKLNVKAEGVFTDLSHQDISASVDWHVTGPVKVEKGTLYPLRMGKAQVYAQYSGVKSLPANINIVISAIWLLLLIIKTAALLISAFILLFAILYFLTEKERERLKTCLNEKPSEFIIELYANIKGILSIFGFAYRDNLAPISYADLIQKRYSVTDNVFLHFTTKFEEARYSRHFLKSEDALAALSDYNRFLKTLLSRYGKFALFFKYLSTLIQKRPLYI